MPSSEIKNPGINEPRIGECAAMQPVSGIARVEDTTAVSGLGRGAFTRKEEPGKTRDRR